jgi:regulator of replication initiation timing
MKKLLAAVGLALLLAAALAAAEETLPWRVEVAKWEGLEPGADATVVLEITVKEPGDYAAYFRLEAFARTPEGKVVTVDAGEGYLTVKDAGVYNLTIRGRMPENLVCGSLVYVTGIVTGYGESSFAVYKGKESPFEIFYILPADVACQEKVLAALKLWDAVGGYDGAKKLIDERDALKSQVSSLTDENRQLRGQLADLADRIKRLEAEKGALQAEVERQAAENARLKARLEAANKTVADLEARLGSISLEAERWRTAAFSAVAGAALLATALVALALKRRRK